MIVIALSLSSRIFPSFLRFSDPSLAAKEPARGSSLSWWPAGWLVLPGLCLEEVVGKNRFEILRISKKRPQPTCCCLTLFLVHVWNLHPWGKQWTLMGTHRCPSGDPVPPTVSCKHLVFFLFVYSPVLPPACERNPMLLSVKVVFNTPPLPPPAPPFKKRCLKIRIRTLAPVIKRMLISCRPMDLT